MKWLDLDYPQIILAVLTIVMIGGLVIAASTSGVAFGSYNSAWDGASELRAEAEAVGVENEIVRNTSQYGTVPSNDTLAVVLSPQKSYGPAESDRIRSFVHSGGTLLIAEDFGNHSNDLLARIGAQARIDGRLLRDERYHYQSPTLPIARNVSNETLVAPIDQLTLNRGTPVRPRGADVLVSSSEYAALDTNRNGNLDDREPVGTYPVATIESVGDGRVIAVGDPSAFINTMLDRSGNQAFIRTLFDTHERVLFDYSHTGELPPLSVALLIVRDSPLLQILLGTGLLMIVGVWMHRLRPFQQTRRKLGWETQTTSMPTVASADADALASFIRKQHPDWDDERVERVIQGIMTRRKDSSSNDEPGKGLHSLK